MTVPMGKAEAILAAAQRVFGIHGYSRTRIEDIAQEAGVGKGTVYEYFPSKKAVFEEAVEAAIKDYMDDMAAELTSTDSPVGKLQRIAVLHLEFVARHQDFARIILADPGLMSPHRQNLINISHQAQMMVASVVKEGTEQGAFRPLDAMFVTHAFFGVLSSIGGVCLMNEKPWRPEEVAARIMDVIVGGLASREDCLANGGGI